MQPAAAVRILTGRAWPLRGTEIEACAGPWRTLNAPPRGQSAQAWNTRRSIAELFDLRLCAPFAESLRVKRKLTLPIEVARRRSRVRPRNIRKSFHPDPRKCV